MTTARDFTGDEQPATSNESSRPTGVDLYRANLRGADLSRADLREANLSEARYNADTTWPDGFDPHKAGAVKIND